MIEEKRKMLADYIRGNVAPILIDFLNGENIPNSVLLEASCSIEDLNGHYSETNFVPPIWMSKILNKKEPTILVINRIDSISKKEQKKFIEILKYRKVSTFELPKNTVIILTAKEINNDTIDEEVYSLVAHIIG